MVIAEAISATISAMISASWSSCSPAREWLAEGAGGGERVASRIFEKISFQTYCSHVLR